MDVDTGDEIAVQLAHYIDRVRKALGLSGRSWYTDLGPPVAAYLAVEGHVAEFPDRDVALVWDELVGWSAVVEGPDNDVVLAVLGGEVVPPPAEVVRFVSRLLRGEQPDTAVPGPRGTVLDRPTGLSARLRAGRVLDERMAVRGTRWDNATVTTVSRDVDVL